MLKMEYADLLGGAPPGLPQERGVELVLKKGDALMQRPRQVKRLSEGELAKLSTQLSDSWCTSRPRLDPAVDGRACCVGGVRAEAQ
jgi:hypothetical protein